MAATVGPSCQVLCFSGGKISGTKIICWNFFWPLAGGSWQVAVGRWQLAGGSWQVEVGRWQFAGGS